MPSAHSAMVTATVVAIGFTRGYNSGEFALALVFALIVLHDAVGVRRLVGKHSLLLQKLVGEKSRDDLGELPSHLVGHSPQEVLVGAAIGVVVAVLMFNRGPVVWQVAKHLGSIALRHHARL